MHSIRFIKVGSTKTKVVYLEMTSPPIFFTDFSLKDFEIRKLNRPTTIFYRYLYDLVGGSWNWTQRKLLGDENLLEQICKDTVEIYVAFFHNEPIGYIELEDQGGEFEIVYFGISPSFFGRGFGKSLLSFGLKRAWEKPNTRKVWLHTCDLDGPYALSTYLKFGFKTYNQCFEEVALIEPVI